MSNTILERLATLRSAMSADNVDAVIIPQSDPHHSEYLADHWQMRRYFSGFTGSAGTLVVATDTAALWTDSRYFLQAETQLAGTGIVLEKEGVEGTPGYAEWIAAQPLKHRRVAFDPQVLAAAEADTLIAELDAAGIAVDTDFFARHADLWPDRPELPTCPVYIHDTAYAGRSAADKVADILDRLPAQAGGILISALDEIAWTLNIRANDVSYNPVATSHLLLTRTAGNRLFIDPRKLTPEVQAHLEAAGVATLPYEALLTELAALPADMHILANPATTSHAARLALGARLLAAPSPVAMLKAVKNDVQISGIRAAMVRDGVAMVKALRAITDIVAAGKPLTEMDIPKILTYYRSQGEHYVEESFETIAGYGPHGAIVHYAARPETNAEIHLGNLLLIDSGANYLDGTTDITRTIALGEPTPQQRHDFTRVMQGHIALAQCIWPRGTRGHQLDAIARMPLWKEGKMYLHGTGHGIGHFLCVHEGPQSVRLNDTGAPLLPGMLVSNEPGLYLEGRYGIRCENLCLVVEDAVTEFGPFYRFETVTLCPFDRNLFDTALMTPDEIDWLNAYHATVCRTLAPLLDGADLAWLKNATLPL